MKRYDILDTQDGCLTRPAENGLYVLWSEVKPLLPRWVSMKERLPKKNTDVLVCTIYGDILMDYMDRNDEWKDVLDEVTHWMPLPPLPTETP